MENTDVYVTLLHDSLQKKMKIVQQLLELTRQQQAVLAESEVDTDAFDELVEKKAVLLTKMSELDRGFETIYQRIGDSLVKQKEHYRTQILGMQNYIRVITDTGASLEALEHANKERFEQFLKRNREEIRQFKVSNRTAARYYQNMANQHQAWQSYFMDQKK